MSKQKNNADLQTARNNKADEFYTMYSDIEAEMNLYNFAGKSVFCPCDNPEKSNFYKFFKDNFDKLGLNRLVSFFYNPGKSYYIEYNGVSESVTWVLGIDAGDFKSNVSKRLMNECDVVVTNPPFSLFRQFIKQVVESGKEYIVLGNVNAITYKEVFRHIVDSEMWLGGTIHSGDRKFYIPDDYPLDGTACGVDEDGLRYIRVKGVRWFTNMKYSDVVLKRNVLEKSFYEDESYYQKYDDYDAINVNSMKEIPYDYLEDMGVPITVLDKMNVENGLIEFSDKNGKVLRFELVGQLNGGRDRDNYDFAKPVIYGVCKFKRLVMRRV